MSLGIPSIPLRGSLSPSIVKLKSSRAIHYHLSELVKLLDPARCGSEPTAPSEGIERWDDENYLYLQLRALGTAAAGLDINVHDDQAFIRVERD